MKRRLYTDLTRNGECTACGECCSNLLPLTRAEVERIRKYVASNGIKPQSNVALFTREPTIFGDCPFLDRTREKKCLIYEARPLICRDFRCDKGSTEMSEELLKEKRFVVNMRETFGGGRK